jgi:hypothetical protein
MCICTRITCSRFHDILQLCRTLFWRPDHMPTLRQSVNNITSRTHHMQQPPGRRVLAGRHTIVSTASLGPPTQLLSKASTNGSMKLPIPTVNTDGTADGNYSSRPQHDSLNNDCQPLRLHSPLPTFSPASPSQVLRAFHMQLTNHVSLPRPRILPEPQTSDNMPAACALATTAPTFRQHRFFR